jgi:chorismate dehydratase
LDRKIRIGAVNYLNTKPLIYGFGQGLLQDKATLVLDYPAQLAQQLIHGQIDIGLIPVAAIPRLPQHYLIGRHCIACQGEVASVCLFSQVPIGQIDTILLDYQSRTSVALLKILLQEHWQVAPQLLGTAPGYEQQISGTTAGLVIGDRALNMQGQFEYVYDLGLAWQTLTGLPFVFAAWVATSTQPDDFVAVFDQCVGMGLQHLAEIATAHPLPHYSLLRYYTENIQYTLDAEKEKALALFLSKLKVEN